MSSRPLHVCMYTPSAHGGHARYTHELLSALGPAGRDRAVRVSLVTSRTLAPEFRDTPYPVYDILPPIKPRHGQRAFWRYPYLLVHLTRRERAFLTWIRTTAPCTGVQVQELAPWLAPRQFRALRRSGLGVFATVHNVRPHHYPRGVPAALYDAWHRAAWRQCHALFVHTDRLRQSLAAFLGPDHPPIVVAPHGLWRTPNSVVLLDDETRRQRQSLLFFGVVRPNKGLHVLLAAMQRLPGHRLVVAGEWRDRGYGDRVRALLRDIPPDRVTIVDRYVSEDEKAVLYRDASLAILPYTTFDAQSGVLHDALAYGLPVVASDVGALGESVRRWGVGEVVPPADPAALAAAIARLSAHRPFHRACQAIGRVRADLSWSRAAELTIEAYRSLGPTA